MTVRGKVVKPPIILKKAPVKIGIRKWQGKCAATFAKLGYSSVDQFIADVRGSRAPVNFPTAAPRCR